MLVPIGDAEKVLDDLVARAETGDEVVLMRQGRAVVRLVPLARPPLDCTARGAVLEAARRHGRAEAGGTGDAARSQDFLFLDDATPG